MDITKIDSETEAGIDPLEGHAMKNSMSECDTPERSVVGIDVNGRSLVLCSTCRGFGKLDGFVNRRTGGPPEPVGKVNCYDCNGWGDMILADCNGWGDILREEPIIGKDDDGRGSGEPDDNQSDNSQYRKLEFLHTCNKGTMRLSGLK